METVSIIGPGRLGGALAIALSRVGYLIDSLIYRIDEPLDVVLDKIGDRPEIIPFKDVSTLGSDLILITTADTELEAVAGIIASKIAESSVLLHTSGAISSEVLSSAAERGVAVGSMHPLVSVSDPVTGAENFTGAFFCVEGTTAAAGAAEKVVRALGGTSFTIDTRYKPLYHAAAVLASGHLTSLFSTAMETLSQCGVDLMKAKEILLPLAESALSNLALQGPAAALTGPFARTDRDAIRRHLDAFDSSGLEQAKRIYLELGLKALLLSEANGGDAGNTKRIRDLIKLAQESAK